MAPRTRSEKGKEVVNAEDNNSPPESTSNDASQGRRRRNSVSDEIRSLRSEMQTEIQRIVEFFSAQLPSGNQGQYPALPEPEHGALPPTRINNNSTPRTDLRSTLQTRRQVDPDRGETSRPRGREEALDRQTPEKNQRDEEEHPREREPRVEHNGGHRTNTSVFDRIAPNPGATRDARDLLRAKQDRRRAEAAETIDTATSSGRDRNRPPEGSRIDRLEQNIQKLLKNRDRDDDDLFFGTRNPYSREIMEVPLPDKFKMPTIKHYDGTTDPADHLDKYSSWMILHGYSDAITCRAFDSTLEGHAKRWFRRLPEGSIHTWDQLRKLFMTNYVGAKGPEITTDMLLEVKQRQDESLRDWIERFTTAKNSMRSCADQEALMAAKACVWRNSRFAFEMRLHPVDTYAEYIRKARQYANAELPNSGKKKDSATSKEEPTRDKKRGRNSDQAGQKQEKKPREDGTHTNQEGRNPRRQRQGLYTEYHALTATIEEIYVATQNREEYRPPRPLRSDATKRNQTKYCRFHRDRGHDTNDCWDLKDEIEALIRRGRIPEYKVADGPQVNPAPVQREIHTIHGGPHRAGTSRRALKQYAREAEYPLPPPPPTAINAVSQGNFGDSITFTEADAASVHFPHHDPLVVAIQADNSKIHRCLVDNGSSVNVLYLKAFEAMGLKQNSLRPVTHPLLGFAGEVVYPEGYIDFTVVLGDPPHQSVARIEFAIINGKSAYNAILGRPLMAQMKVITSVYHQCLKFPTPT